MTTKVYAVYSIPKSPEYRLEGLFKTKELAKTYIRFQSLGEYPSPIDDMGQIRRIESSYVYDIQIEEVHE